MASLMDQVYGTPMGEPSDITSFRSTMEPHGSLKNSNAKSLPSTIDKNSLSPGNNFRSCTLTTSQPSQLDLQGDASNSSYCEECFYCPECSDHSDCESCADCESCIECDDCDIMMDRTRRYTTGMMGELDGMMHYYNNTTSPNSAPLQHSGDDGWMDFVNIPPDADVTGDQNSAAKDAALGEPEQDTSTTVQTGLPFLDDNSPSNFSTGFPTTEGYTEEVTITRTEYYCLVANPLEPRIVNPSDLFGVGQQFDGIPLNYGDKAEISASPTLAGDDDALFRHIFQAAGIMNAAKMPAMQSPLPAYLPAQAMPVACPADNSPAPTMATHPAARRARRKKTPGNSPPAKKTCAYCPDKGPFDASGLAKHNNSLEHQKARGAAIPTKKYACPYCKKRFPRQDHIKRHILKVIKAANDDGNNNVVVPPKCPVLQKKDADGEQGVWEWELEANGSHSLLKDRNERNPFMMPVGYKARMKLTYGGRHGQ